MVIYKRKTCGDGDKVSHIDFPYKRYPSDTSNVVIKVEIETIGL